MAAVTPSGSAGAIVEITNTAVAPANQFAVSALHVIPENRVAFYFPDGCTNITWRVRQANTEVRFFSDINSSGYYTTSGYSSGQVNTKGVTFCWESDVECDIEVAYWGPAGTVEFEAIKKSISERITITANHLLTKSLQLTLAPALGYNVSITPREGCTQFLGLDFTISEKQVLWNELGLDGLLEVGDILQVDYFY